MTHSSFISLSCIKLSTSSLMSSRSFLLYDTLLYKSLYLDANNSAMRGPSDIPSDAGILSVSTANNTIRKFHLYPTCPCKKLFPCPIRPRRYRCRPKSSEYYTEELNEVADGFFLPLVQIIAALEQMSLLLRESHVIFSIDAEVPRHLFSSPRERGKLGFHSRGNLVTPFPCRRRRTKHRCDQ